MAKNKGQSKKRGEESQETLESIYLNKDYRVPPEEPLETIQEEAENHDPNEEPDNGRPKRRAAKSYATREVRKLNFVPYFVSDKARDKKRHQKVVEKTKNGKPYKWKGLTEEQEEKLITLLEEQSIEDDDILVEDDLENINERLLDTTDSTMCDEEAIKSAINTVLSAKRRQVPSTPQTSERQPPRSASISKSKKNKVPSRRRRSSTARNLEDELSFSEFETPAKIPKTIREEDNIEFTRQVNEADSMLGPLDLGEDRQVKPLEDDAWPKTVVQKVRRSSRFFRSNDRREGSVFTEVEMVEKKDRRKSRRSNFVKPVPQDFLEMPDS